MFYSISVVMNNITLIWLCSCICTTRPCQCLTKLNSNIITIITTTSQEKTTRYTTQNSKWYVMFTILTTSIQEGIHMDNITILFEQYFKLLTSIHTCMQWIHLIVIWYLISLVLDKEKLENHWQPIIPTHATNKINQMGTEPQELILHHDAFLFSWAKGINSHGKQTQHVLQRVHTPYSHNTHFHNTDNGTQKSYTNKHTNKPTK